ncbi:MAG: ABC transporter permease [Hydrogenoanaerobacterium sp.]
MDWIKQIRQKYPNELVLAAILAGLFCVIGILSPDQFLSGNNMRSMMFQMSEFGFIALGMMAVILTGGISLSIVSQAALSSIVGAFILTSPLTQASPVVGIIAAIAACLITSAITGAFNAYFVAYLGVAPILVTLGTMTLFNGISLNFTKGGAISGFPEAYSVIGNETLLGVPIPILIYVLGVIVSYFLLERSAWGTEVYMIGCNETASRFSAINTRKALLKVYVFSGLMAGISGIIMSSRYNSAKLDYGSSYVMQSVAAVVLGGTRISGGHGTVAGTVLAVCIIQIVSSGLNILGVNRYVVDIVIGGILLVVLSIRMLFGKGKRLSLPIRKKRAAKKVS